MLCWLCVLSPQFECKEWQEALNVLDMIENNNPMALLSQSLNESLCDLVNKEVSDREQQPHGFTVTKS